MCCLCGFPLFLDGFVGLLEAKNVKYQNPADNSLRSVSSVVATENSYPDLASSG